MQSKHKEWKLTTRISPKVTLTEFVAHEEKFLRSWNPVTGRRQNVKPDELERSDELLHVVPFLGEEDDRPRTELFSYVQKFHQTARITTNW